MTHVPVNEIETQERVFQFLTDPHRHPTVQRIDTHAASVFLEDTHALKIKRAVRFPFLDYSTLEKRRVACEDEIRINRALAPDIYRRVVAITLEADGTLQLDGEGRPVEYAVEMTRFDERQTLDHVAAAGVLADAQVMALADVIAASHIAAPRRAGQPWLEGVPALIAGNDAALRRAACFDLRDLDDLTQTSLATASRINDLLAQRGEQGFVRRCHGDLHLANIVLINGRPMLFDAIEFDEKIATIDVLYDLGFVLMDLLCYEQALAANLLLNRYLAISPVENLAGLASLPLFMSMRAAVRAHVLHARMEREPTEQPSISTNAMRYFRLAGQLIHPPAPRLIAVGGLSGTGKSVLARRLAAMIEPLPGAVVLRTDVLRKQLFGLSETSRLPATAYQPDVTARVYRLVEQRAGEILAQGHSVAVDAVYARENDRLAIEAVAGRLRVPFHGLFLTADVTTRRQRITLRASDASDATVDIAERQQTYDLGQMDWTMIDAGGTPEQTSAHASRFLVGKGMTLCD